VINISLAPAPSPGAPALDIPVCKVIERLDTLLMIAKSCKGKTRIELWPIIHRKGGVKKADWRLHERLDTFNRSMAQSVGYTTRESGYLDE
jgi:N-acetylglucosamine-6-sulfatase